MSQPRGRRRERSDWFASWLKHVSKVRMEMKGVVAPTIVGKSAEEMRKERRASEKKTKVPG